MRTIFLFAAATAVALWGISSILTPSPALSAQPGTTVNTRDKLKGATKTQGDFNLSNRFTVEIDGVVVPNVVRIESADLERVLQEFSKTRKGGDVNRPGRITITKDWSNTSEWYKWRKAVIEGRVQRKSVSIIFHNDAGEEARMNFFHCFPTKWQGPELNAKSSGHATEKIEVQWETMELKAAG